MCGNNLMVLKHESEKLIAYSEGRKITLEDVKKVCFPWEDPTLFDLIDSFFERDTERTLRVLRDAYTKGTHPIQILGMLSGYVTKLYVVHELLSEGDRLENALEKVGVKHQFAKLKFKNYLDKTSKSRARELLENLYKLDYALKVSFADPHRSLEKFATDYTLR